MKRTLLCLCAGLVLTSASAFAGSQGTVSSDRFGYDGYIYRYANMEDAWNQNADGLQQTMGVGEYDPNNGVGRDLSVYVSNGHYDSTITDGNYLMGSWWYTTDAQGRAGYGNTRGNTGAGYVQLYDADASTGSLSDTQFSGWDGTYWTQFEMRLAGANADAANDIARLSAPWNVGDAGTFLFYDFSMVATGLQGVMGSNGWIEAESEPTDVTGYFRGIFQNTSTSKPENNGFYVFDFTLDMDNWAFDNQNTLTGDYEFAGSYFAAPGAPAVPEPASMLLGLMGLAPVVGFAKLRKK